MSEPTAPTVALVFGSITPPQGDLVSLLVHLGCSREVSSFSVKLQNWNDKYSAAGPYPITKGLTGSINLGRGSTCPLLLTLKVEDTDCEDTPTEHYITVSGRCWGERIFRKTVTKNFANSKGEEIVKYLMDNYARLSHTRGSTELVENTDTTFTNLDYVDSPALDILKYVAETADKSGVIGFDFRVAPDGKFEFFRKLSKTNSVIINDNIDVRQSIRENITRVRNKIKIDGLADKSVPTNKVDWTRSLTPSAGVWSAGSGVVGTDTGPDGGICIKLTATTLYVGNCLFTLNAGQLVNSQKYPILSCTFELDDAFSGTGFVILHDSTGKIASKSISVTPDEDWHIIEVGTGPDYAKQWETVTSGFDWTNIWKVGVSFYFPQSIGTGSFRVHSLYFGGCRYSAVAEDLASQIAYTDGEPREYVETDEELWSDNECDLRAKALLAYLKDPAIYMTLTSTLFDYGSSPVLGGDKVFVTLTNKGVNTWVRVDSVDYEIPENETSTLQITLNLDKVPPKIADYLYGLRTFTVNVEKLSRTKLGRRGVPVSSFGGSGGNSYFTSNVEIDKTAPVLNLLIGRTLKAAFGHDGSNAFLTAYSGNLVLYSAAGKILPDADGSQNIGDSALAKRFGSLHLKNDLWVAGVQVVDTNGRVTLPGFARDDAGKVLEAQGAGFYPMYVDPNGRYLPATHSHDSVINGNRKVQVDASNAVLNFYVDASLKGAVGHDGANYFVVAYAGNLVLWSATGKILPNGSMDLGETSTKFGNGYFSGVMDVGWLNVGGFTVINSSRQLVNTSVSAASIDRDGVTADVPVAKVGGGTRTLHFVNSRYTGYTDS